MSLHTYLPQDRLRALARGEILPDHSTGSALFADISGFTPLTESLRNTLGPRRGAEELTHHLDVVYTALITEVEKYGGSVIAFAGDAILCWFDDAQGPAAARAVSCALVLQNAMRQFEAITLPDRTALTLELKVAVATGPARRFVVGNPEVHYLDALAGATITRTGVAEHLAKKGEILVDEATTRTLEAALAILEWRTSHESYEQFAVVPPFTDLVIEAVGTEPLPTLPLSTLCAWLHHAVYEREQAGQGAFLTEFRPAVALFVRFVGIDYDADDAYNQLDAFIRKAQSIITRYEGTLLQLTIGDKGSYLLINFGALSVHEDDSYRAVKTAWELRASAAALHFLAPLQMGIARGIMRVGAYGSPTRHTYGTMGDDVNLAARLMQTASPGEILLSGGMYNATANDFAFEPRQPLSIRGKTEPQPVFALTGKRQRRAIRLQEPRYALPMVGRLQELQTIESKLDLALQGQGQVIGIVAEAGLGKSRLVAEVIRVARSKGFTGYGGACRSDAINTPYQAWKSIWRAFFDVDPDASLRREIRWLEGELEDRAPERLQALPLLSALLNLAIPDNAFTKTLEPKTRRSALHALLEDCLKDAAKEEPLLIVIEDLHWIDALSHDLLNELARTTLTFRICFMLAYRPPQIQHLQAPSHEGLPQFTRIELSELNQAECEQAVRAKLAQLYPAHGGAVPPVLVEKLMGRSQGNPFYLEELLNYLRDRGLDPYDPANLDKIELPDSLHILILSRIDRLTEREKTTLRVASVIGRLFRAKWLTGYYPDLGTLSQVKAMLDELDSLDITLLNSPEPDLAYLFKHIVTHEVTYESLPFATRAQLHEQLAQYLESIIGEEHAPPLLDTLAFHYGRSENVEKQREYLHKAGEAAQKNFANDAALAYYTRLLPLLNERERQIEIQLKRGEVWERIGKWDDAETDYRAALDSAKDDMALKAGAQFALGKLSRQRGDFAPALVWLEEAKEIRTALEDKIGLAQVFVEMGIVLWRKAEYEEARETLNQGLLLSQELRYPLRAAQALNSLGLVAMYQGDYSKARTLYEESLGVYREIGDKAGISAVLNNLGILTDSQGDYATARELYQESASLDREIGNKAGISFSLNNLGIIARVQGDHATAQTFYEEGLRLRRELGDKYGIAMFLNNLGIVELAQGGHDKARGLFQESLNLFHEIEDKSGIASSLKDLANVALAQGDTSEARTLFEESLVLCKEMGEKPIMASCLLGLGLVKLAENMQDAREHILNSLRLRQETGEQLSQISSLLGVAALAFREGNAPHAAQWLGAVESGLRTLRATIEPDMIPLHAQTLAVVRERLGESAFQSAWEEGSQWSLENAVRLALEESED